MRQISYVLGLLLVAQVLGACASSASPQTGPSKSQTTTINKDVHVPIDGGDLLRVGMEAAGADAFQPGLTPCRAAEGMVEEGDQVTIQNADGSTIALGELGTGILGEGEAPISSPCVFTVSIDEVPLGEGFYEITVGGGAAITVTEDSLINPLQHIVLK